MAEKDRLRRIFENSEERPDVVAIVNGSHPDPNFFYISGYTTGLFENNMLFRFPDRRVEVLTNPLDEGAARQKPEHVVHVERSLDPSGRKKLVDSILKDCRRVGVNFRGLSHRDYLDLAAALPKKRLIDVSQALGMTRMVKDPDELASIAKASKIISDVVDEVPEVVDEGVTEKALKAEIDYNMLEKGADSPSFESIVAFGESSAFPHYSAGDRKLRRGDNVLVDVGARYHLYCSDITRTFFFGKARPSQKEAYAKVLEAQSRAMASIKEGADGREVHRIAARVIDKSRFKGRFTHGLGHSLGLEVHDGPGLSLRNPATLARGMVMTVEPGIYVPKEGGVRIEDDVAVTRDSFELLTKSPKDLVEI